MFVFSFFARPMALFLVGKGLAVAQTVATDCIIYYYHLIDRMHS